MRRYLAIPGEVGGCSDSDGQAQKSLLVWTYSAGLVAHGARLAPNPVLMH